MARRRSLSQDDNPDPGSGFDLAPRQGGGGRVDEFGNVVPDFSNDPNYPTPFVDYTPPEIGGNPESPRDIFGTQQPRTFKPPSGPAPRDGQVLGRDPERESGGLDEILAMLPQGVEAKGDGDGGQSMAAPLSSPTPRGASLSAMPPASTPGPARQSISSPSNLFGGDGGGSSLISRGGGQFGGGVGMPGGPSGGPTATKQMLELLKSLGI